MNNKKDDLAMVLKMNNLPALTGEVFSVYFVVLLRTYAYFSTNNMLMLFKRLFKVYLAV